MTVFQKHWVKTSLYYVDAYTAFISFICKFSSIFKRAFLELLIADQCFRLKCA